MKLNKIMLLFFVIMLSQKMLTQELSEDQKKWIIKEISFSDTVFGWYQIVDSGLARAVRYKVIEAIPTIETELWKRSDSWSLQHLDALYKLNDPNAHNITLAYFDTLDKKDYDDFYKLEQRIDANEILMNYNDYSKIDYIFQALENDKYKDDFTGYALRQLPIIIKNVPSQAQRAIGILESTVSTAKSADDRLEALSLLENLYGFGAFPFMKKMFNEDTDGRNRFSVLNDYLKKYKNEEVNKFIKERYPFEKEVRFRMEYILLYDYGSLSDYKFLWDFNQTETDTEAKKDLETALFVYGIMSSYIASIEPGKFRIPINFMLDTLSSYNKQCTSYNWLDTALSNDIINKIQNSKNFLNKGDSINCAKQINSLKKEVNYEFNDTLNITKSFITHDGYNFLYYYSKQILRRLPSVPQLFDLNIILNGNGTIEKNPSQTEYDSSSTVTLTAKPSPGYIFKEWTGDITGTNASASIVMNSNKNITAVFAPASSGLTVRLTNSSGELLTNGSLQYYEGSWKDAVNNNDGTFTVNTTRTTISLRMTYEGGSQTKQNVPTGTGDIVFQTVNAQVKLQDSNGNPLDGTVQYYAGSWRSFGSTSNGTASKELLPANYSFRMTYAYGSTDIKQDLNVNPTVVFKTVNTQVQLKNSLGSLIDQGTVQYYAGAWRQFGATSSGTASKELLPGNYSFRVTYEYVSNDKQQDISTNNVVSFSTVLCTIRVKDAQSQPASNAQVSYYSGAWRLIGSTVNGEITKELLPADLSFRAKLGTKQADKKQNLAVNSIVEISLP